MKFESRPEITPDLEAVIIKFLKRTPPERLSRNVRTLLLEFLLHRHEYLPSDFSCWVDDLHNLFDFLDRIADIKASR